jgi:Mn2+/Fe2+ NRAMP family transporter
MWWIVFTAVDLYIGIVVLKTMESSVPPEKRKRLKIAERVVLVLLGITAVAFLVKLFHRPH